MRGLGRAFDICSGIVPVDLAGGANTGHRVHMKNYGGCAIVVFFENGAATEDVIIDVQQHTAATGGTSNDLDVAAVTGTGPITEYYTKSEASLDGDETWTRVAHTGASEITDANWGDELQAIVVIEVEASQLADGYEWLSVNIPDTGATAGHLGAVLYVMYDLAVQRAPQNLAQPNA